MDNLSLIAIILLIVIVYCCINRSQFGATPPPPNLDLSKIKGSWNPGTLSITSGVLEYKPGNLSTNGDLELPYPVLDKNYYRVSIVIGTLTGNRSPITIKPLTGTVYNDNLSSILSVQTFIAESNKTITFNIMATKALNAVYIKVTTANKTDILRIKSVTIQKLSPPAAPSALPPPPPPKIAPPPPPTSAGPARAAPLSKEAAAREAELKAKAAQAAQAAAAAVKDNSAAVAKANDVIQKGTAYLTKFKNFADVTTKKHVEAVITLAQKIVADNGKVQTNNTAILNDLKNKYPDLKK